MLLSEPLRRYLKLLLYLINKEKGEMFVHMEVRGQLAGGSFLHYVGSRDQKTIRFVDSAFTHRTNLPTPNAYILIYICTYIHMHIYIYTHTQ